MTANEAANEVSYPDGYTPMTDDEHFDLYIQFNALPLSNDNYAFEKFYERAVLARLPKPDTAEREALVQRIDEATQSANAFRELFRDIRAHLVGENK